MTKLSMIDRRRRQFLLGSTALASFSIDQVMEKVNASMKSR